MATLNAPKLINVSFSLANGNFGSSGGNTYSTKGKRIQVHIDIKGSLQYANCSLAIYGLPLSVMNQLTTFGTQYLSQKANIVKIEAGDNQGMSLIFDGNIYTAFVDGQSQPQVCLRVEGTPGTWWNIKPAPVLSFQGATKATTIAQKIATNMNMGFIDHGVKTVLSNPYFASDAMTQLIKLAEQANFGFMVHKNNVTITPANGTSGNKIVVSPQTGLVGYPLFTSNQVIVKTIFNPNISWNDIITIQSSLTPACGNWKVYDIEYDLESKTPHGKWFSTFSCYPLSSSNTPQQT